MLIALLVIGEVIVLNVPASLTKIVLTVLMDQESVLANQDGMPNVVNVWLITTDSCAITRAILLVWLMVIVHLEELEMVLAAIVMQVSLDLNARNVIQASGDRIAKITAQKVVWLTVFAVKVLMEMVLAPAKVGGEELNVPFVMMAIMVINVNTHAQSLVPLTEFVLMVSLAMEHACHADLNLLEITASCVTQNITMVPNVSIHARIFVLKEVIVLTVLLEQGCAPTALAIMVETSAMDVQQAFMEKPANLNAQNLASCLDSVTRD